MKPFSFKCLGVLGMVGVVSSAAFAADYPTRAIDLIVPYAPGGTTDLVARIVAAELGKELGQPVIVLNKPGAGGAIGSVYAMRQNPDGYTLVMAVESSHAVNPNVQSKPQYDPIQDFAPVSNLVNVLGVLDVGAESNIVSFEDLLQKTKNTSSNISYGSSGMGGYSHLFGELFQKVTGSQMLHVPYKGLGPALVDLMGGQVDVVFDNLPSSDSGLKSGKLKALAVAAPQRVESMPDVPTYEELGFPELNNPSWFGLAAPKNTPEEIVLTVNLALEKVLSNPEVVKSIERQGAIPAYSSSQDFGELIKESNERWKKVVDEIGFEKL